MKFTQLNIRAYQGPVVISPEDDRCAISFSVNKQDLLEIAFQVATELSNLDNKFLKWREETENELWKETNK